MTVRMKHLVLAIAAAAFSATTLSGVSASTASTDREVLYWYDPMYPQQRFDAPGPSPFMDMDLVPRYADDSAGTSVNIDASIVQNLGIRTGKVAKGVLEHTTSATGMLAFNTRDLFIVQSRSGGFVERVYGLSPDDVVTAGDPLVDLLVPEWTAVQEEYLAMREIGEPDLMAAARQRMRLAGMPLEMISRVERTGQAESTWTITSPASGVITSLSVYDGMTLPTGGAIVDINGLSSIWLEVAVPESQAGQLNVGSEISATLPAFPGETFTGLIQTILPRTDTDSRTVRLRVELPNPNHRLRPGMTADAVLSHSARESLLVPSEAIIRTGRRTLVMLSIGDGRYQPAEVVVGREGRDQTEIIDGLEAGQEIVISGQFLLDSEASLRGLEARSLGEPPAPALHEAEGVIESITGDMISLNHGPFETLNMPGMTMPFMVANRMLLEDVPVGAKVRVGVSESDLGLIVERIELLHAPAHAAHGGH
jgi:Cu(I)/Ag(I) efflux system membrane fusion protein